jgi:hypothetical protein
VIYGGDGSDLEEGVVGLSHTDNPNCRYAGWVDSVGTARDEEVSAFKHSLSRNVGNGQRFTACTQGETMHEGVLGLHRNRRRDVGEELKPVPLAFTSYNSSGETLSRDNGCVTPKQHRMSRPHLHCSADEITVGTATDECAGLELDPGTAKVPYLSQGVEIDLQEQLSRLKLLELQAHLTPVDDQLFHSSDAEKQVDPEIDRSLGNQYCRFDHGPNPRIQNGRAASCLHLECSHEFEQNPHENRAKCSASNHSYSPIHMVKPGIPLTRG